MIKLKAIIFDIDGVIVKSMEWKSQIIKDVLTKFQVYGLTWVHEILESWVNRKLILNQINALYPFDYEQALHEINKKNAKLENNPTINEGVVNFIKENYKNYSFFTNTALPEASMQRIINKLNISFAFKELRAFEDWSKTENVNYVLNTYNLYPNDVLFIDDNINHIHTVWKNTWVYTLHFYDYMLSIEKEIKTIK